MSIDVVTSIGTEPWEQFLAASSEATVYHTPQYHDAFRDSDRYTPHAFFLVDQGNVMASITALQTRIMGDFLPSFTSRVVSYGGIAIRDGVSAAQLKKHLGKLIEAYDSTLRSQAVYSEIRNITDPMHILLSLVNQGHQFDSHLNYLIDLGVGEEGLWKNLAGNRRREISKARDQIRIVEVTEESQVEAYSRLVTDTYKKLRTPCFEPEVYKRVWKSLHPAGFIRMTLAEYQGEFVSAFASLNFQGRSIEWFIGSDATGDRLIANPVLVWDGIEWACRNGYTLFDFGGAGEPNKPYSVRDFKRRFGGDLVNPGRFTRTYSPVRYAISSTAYSVLRGVLFR